MSQPPRPLLPTLAVRSKLDAALRENLRILAERTDSDALRHRIQAVLDGTASLRDLARTPEFGQLMEPLVADGARRLAALTPEQRADLERQAERAYEI